MKYVWAVVISGVFIVLGLVNFLRVLEQGCTTSSIRGFKFTACGVHGYIHAAAFIGFGLVVGYYIWTYSSKPTKS